MAPQFPGPSRTVNKVLPSDPVGPMFTTHRRGPLLATVGLLLALALAGTAHAAPDVDVRVDARADAGAPLAGAPAGAPELPSTPKEAPGIPPLAPAARDALEPVVALDVGAPGASAKLATGGARASSAQGDATGAGPAAAVNAVVAAIPEPVREAAPPALAAAGLAALLQAFGGFRVAGLGAFALYSRLTRSELLDNEHRDRVYKLVQEKPGVGMTEVGERLGLGWGTVVYHLDRLEKAGFVASERAGLHRCYFPVGTVARESRAALGALKAPAAQTQLCEALGLSASAASKQVSKLESAGLLRRERDWKTVHLYPAPKLPQLLGDAGAPASVAPGAVAPGAVAPGIAAGPLAA
jgi:DNA-binding MarR family transcriptional regulator